MAKEYWSSTEDRAERRDGPSAESMVALPALESMLPRDMKGLRVLDMWCGDGTRAIAIARRGATVAIMHESEAALNKAFQRLSMEGLHSELVVGGAETLDHLPEASYDVAVGDVELLRRRDPAGALRSLARVVRPGGAVILTLPHPVLSGGTALTDGHGTRKWILNDYFEAKRTEGLGPQTIADYINPLIGSGLAIELVLEPRPPMEMRKVSLSNFAFYDHVPQYLIVVARKPGGKAAAPAAPRMANGLASDERK